MVKPVAGGTGVWVNPEMRGEDEREWLNEIYTYNLILFDFVLKRTIKSPGSGKKLSKEVFLMPENATMKKILLSVLLTLSNSLLADVPAEQVKEVAHLLQYVENSECILIRNGSEHKAKQAVSHIQNKYNYFRDDINSTEDFILYSAAKSTMSGRYYTVVCPGKETIKTQKWLLDELKQLRSNDQYRNNAK